MEYILKRHNRAKQLKISLRQNGEIVITVPQRMRRGEILAQQFFDQKRAWISEHQQKMKLHLDRYDDACNFSRKTRADYLLHKEQARKVIQKRVEYFATILREVFPKDAQHFYYKKIAIRDQKSRWGSCSSQKNLNFSYKLLFLPEDLRDYIIVHELCHLKEMNHSERFWNLVAGVVPNYRALQKELKQNYCL